MAEEREFSLDIAPFVVLRSEANRIKSIQQQHEILLSQSEKISDENISQVSVFLNTIAKTGAFIQNPQYRSQLRALIRYWSNFLEDKGEQLSSTQLEPFNASQPQDIQSENATNILKTAVDRQERQMLQTHKIMLENMRDTFSFEVDLRTISSGFIDMLEKDLRDIIRNIEMLRRTSDDVVYKFLSSVDGVIHSIKEAIATLYLVSDLLGQKHTANNRALLYQKLMEVPLHLTVALEYFRIEDLQESSDSNQNPNQTNKTA